MEITDNRSITSFDTKSQSSANYQMLGMGSQKDNVKVIIRVRPLNEREKNNGGTKKCITVDNDTTVQIEAKPDIKSYNFDFVGDENIEQETIFNNIARPIADGCLEGYNGSIFAYGQTGAGKTFTIQGPCVMVNGEEQIYGSYKKDGGPEQEQRGIMQRSFEYIFDCVDKARQKAEDSQDESQFQYLVRCSYLEIYNEQIMDLLEPTSGNLHIREDIKKGVYVEGLQEEVVQSASDMINIISTGAKNRHVGSTSMNKESSRSHSVLTTIIETKSMKEGGVWNIKTSRFHIIDLAGSERSKYTNAGGERLKEAGMINKSLSALGNVINSLVDISEGKSRHVHYRDSKLTFLLRDSLGGNSKTVIIANISPSSICYGETLSTLKFAQRAKLIRNKAVINEDSSGTISLLKSEISRLKKELAENENISKTLNSNPNSYKCSICKTLIGNDNNLNNEDDDEDELLINNISVCEDMDVSNMNATHSGPLNEVLKQKFKNQKDDLLKMRKRVVHLEGLLSANLDSLTSQQKFYDHDIQKQQQQNKKLQQAVESYEKQCARDKMIIKFREDRINKLEQNTPVTKDDQQKIITDLKKEVQLWKEASDHNSQAAKLFAEKADLQKRFDQLQNEYKQSPDTLSAQMRSLTELNESLNQYLRLYCEESKKEVENELSRVKLDYAEKIEQLSEKLNDLKNNEIDRKDKHEKQLQEYQDMIANYKSQIETMNEQYNHEKLEQEIINKQQIEQIKTEIEQICENKTEQERELQMFRVQLLEKEQLYEREKEKKNDIDKQSQLKFQEYNQQVSDLQKQIQDVHQQNAKLEDKIQTNLDHYEHQIEQERKLNDHQLKEREEQCQENMRDLERKIMTESSEKQMLEEQCEQCNDRIKSLEEENETIQQSSMFKEEQIKEIEGQIKEKEKIITVLTEEETKVAQDLDKQKKESSSQLQDLKSQIDELQSQKTQLEQNLKEAQADKQDIQTALDDIKQELLVKIQEKEELNEQIESYITKIETHSNKISTLECVIEQQTEQIQKLQSQIIADESKLKMFEQGSSDQIKSLLNEHKEVKEKLLEEVKLAIAEKAETLQKYELTISEFTIQHEAQIEQIKLIKETEIQNIKQDYQGQLSKINEQHQVLIQEIEVQHINLQEELKQEIQAAKSEVKNYQEQISAFNSDKEELEMTISARIEQISAEKEQIKVELSQQFEELALNKQTEMQQFKIEAQNKINEIVSQYDERISNLEKEKNAEVQEIKKEKNAIEIQRNQEVQELKELQSMNYNKREEELVKQVQLKGEEMIQVVEQLEDKHTQQVTMVKEENQKVVKELENQLMEVKTDKAQEVEKLRHQISQLENEINQLSRQYEASQNTLNASQTNVQKQLQEHQEKVNSLQSQVEQKQQQIQSQLAEKQDFSLQITEIQDQLTSALGEIKTLSIQLDTSLSQNDSLQRECSQLSADLQDTLKNNKALQEQLKESTKQVGDLQKETEQLKTQFQSLKAQYLQQHNQKASDEQEKDQITMELRQKIQEKEDELSKIKQESKEIKEQLEKQKENYQNLENEYHEVSDELTEYSASYKESQQQLQLFNQDQKRQKLLLDDTINSLHTEHMRKYQEQEQQYSATSATLRQEQESLKCHIKDQNHQIAKLRQANEEQNDMLKSSKDTMSRMVHKENELMKELEKNINEFKLKQEKSKVRVKDAKEERDSLRREWDRLKKENENIKELIKLKDRQIEEQLNSDEKDKQAIEKIMKENKDLRNQLTKREFEMKDLVRTLKFYSEEKTRLEKEIEKLNRENDQLIGHKNPSQKIQHHVKIKEENNKLREENFKLQEELRRKIEIIQKFSKGDQANLLESIQNQQEPMSNQSLKDDLKKIKKENVTYQETINRLVDHILTQPGLFKAIGLTEDTNERLMQQNGPTKVKKAMELISMLSNVISTKEREVKDLEREIKKYECRLDIVEKEKILCKQQLEMMSNSNYSNGGQHHYGQNNSGYYNKRSPSTKNELLLVGQNSQVQNDHLMVPKQASRLHVEGFIDDKNQIDFKGINKHSPSPIYNIRHQKEKENIQSKRELFGQQNRSGSGQRTYLSNGQLQNIQKY